MLVFSCSGPFIFSSFSTTTVRQRLDSIKLTWNIRTTLEKGLLIAVVGLSILALGLIIGLAVARGKGNDKSHGLFKNKLKPQYRGCLLVASAATCKTANWLPEYWLTVRGLSMRSKSGTTSAYCVRHSTPVLDRILQKNGILGNKTNKQYRYLFLFALIHFIFILNTRLVDSNRSDRAI